LDRRTARLGHLHAVALGHLRGDVVRAKVLACRVPASVVCPATQATTLESDLLSSLIRLRGDRLGLFSRESPVTDRDGVRRPEIGKPHARQGTALLSSSSKKPVFRLRPSSECRAAFSSGGPELVQFRGDLVEGRALVDEVVLAGGLGRAFEHPLQAGGL
jgi:hypothetical protein